MQSLSSLLGKFSRISSYISQEDIRDWVIYKLFNPSDRGPQAISAKPKYLSNLKEEKLFDYQEEVFLPELNLIPFKSQKGLLKIDLPSTSVSIDVEKSLSDKGLTFPNSLSDNEDRESFFRFSGLLASIEKNNFYSMTEMKFLENWISYQSNSEEAWGPYTIGERLSNITLFMCRTQCYRKWSESFKKLALEVLSLEAKLLFTKLEYKGETLTCNHFSNNGRGLLWASLLFGNKNLFSLGAKIMLNEYKRIIQKEGVIREGSSHYHFLITRNYFEAMWISEQFEEKECSDLFRSYVKKLSDSCNFFLIDKKIPLFGDISPDSRPEWILQVPYAYQTFYESEGDGKEECAKGWASHFFKKVRISQSFDAPLSKITCLDEYRKLEKGNFVVFCRHNVSGFPLINGHVHCDSGAPIVYFKGKEILSDLGRYTYEKPGDVFLRSESHNSFLLNSRSLESPQRAFFGKGFQKRRFGTISVTESENELKYYFEDYFSSKITIIKKIIVEENEIIIEYFLEKGPDKCKVDLFNYSPIGAQIEIQWPENGKIVRHSKLCQPNRSVEYGKTCSIESVNWRGWIKKGTPLCYKVRPKLS